MGDVLNWSRSDNEVVSNRTFYHYESTVHRNNIEAFHLISYLGRLSLIYGWS